MTEHARNTGESKSPLSSNQNYVDQTEGMQRRNPILVKYTEVPEEEKGEKIREGKDRYRVEEKDATRYAHRKKETIKQQKDHVWSQER